ncbi:MAG: site-specific DNA-methyltransferase, partial [Campylobacterota bacterium]|nr:site-specific DNA-methyltransferase [Campylobacterota bacterium]
MEQLTLIKEMEILFKTIDKFTDKNEKLFISKILESIDSIDTELIELLISDETAKKHFFTKIKDVYILNQNKLIEFFTMNEYFEHSFTS